MMVTVSCKHDTSGRLEQPFADVRSPVVVYRAMSTSGRHLPLERGMLGPNLSPDSRL